MSRSNRHVDELAARRRFVAGKDDMGGSKVAWSVGGEVTEQSLHWTMNIFY